MTISKHIELQYLTTYTPAELLVVLLPKKTHNRAHGYGFLV